MNPIKRVDARNVLTLYGRIEMNIRTLSRDCIKAKRYRSILIPLVALFVAIWLAPPASAEAPAYPEVPVDVSLIRLIANPEAFDGKFVRTTGYLIIGFEVDAVYPLEEHWKAGLILNSIRLKFGEMEAPKLLDKKYVIISGTFRAMSPGLSGLIMNIKRLQGWSL
jgi:hypothetical protein